jgi:cytohesin
LVGFVLLPQCVDVDSLHDAAKDGDLKKIRRLLKRGIDVNAKDEFYGRTPLHWAVYNKHKDVVELLISVGAEVDARAKDDKTPLHVAAENGPKDIAELLIAGGADLEAVDTFYGGTPLHWAAYRGPKDVAKLLIKKGANIEAVDTFYEGTPLFLAVRYGNKEVAELLRQNGAQE